MLHKHFTTELHPQPQENPILIAVSSSLGVLCSQIPSCFEVDIKKDLVMSLSASGYSGGRDQEDHGSRLAQANSSQDAI
jgi:hypothetical protein